MPEGYDEMFEGQNEQESNDSTLDSSTNNDLADSSQDENSEDSDNSNLADQQGDEEDDQGNSESENEEDKSKNPKSRQAENFKNLRQKLDSISKEKDDLLKLVKIAQQNPEILKKLKLDDDGEISEQSVRDFSEDANSIFKDIPIPKFKKANEYESIEELFVDIRNGIFSALMSVKDRETRQRTQAEQTYSKQLGQIKHELGSDDTYNAFVDYVSEQIKKPYVRKLGDSVLTVLYEQFNETKGNLSTKVNKSKELSRNISKGKKPTTGDSKKGPDMKYLRERTYDQIIDERLGGGT